MSTSLINGLAILKQTIATCRNNAGCYQMIAVEASNLPRPSEVSDSLQKIQNKNLANKKDSVDSKDSIFTSNIDPNYKYLYIGMAKDVKKRLTSYCYYKKLPTRLIRMLSQLNRIEIIYTESEYEAMVLESNLIKQIKPRYNILLKDDKSLARIKIETKHPYPRIVKYRGKKTSKDAIYYGPFASSSDVNKSVVILHKMFKLRDCSDHSFRNRSRPCLQYQIKRCSAPCVGYISQSDYDLSVKSAIEFLKGNISGQKQILQAKMLEYSAKLEYEKALEVREKLEIFGLLQNEQLAQINLIKDADFLAVFRRGSTVAFGRAIWRGGKFCGQNVTTFSKSMDISSEEILEAWIKQNYYFGTIPRIILTSHPLQNFASLQNYLKVQSNRKIVIRQPKRGVMLRLSNKLIKNLEEVLYQKIMNLDQISDLLQQLTTTLKCKKNIEHIEVYDNSHLSGSFGVCAKIVFRVTGFDKSSYRIYNINYDQMLKTQSKMDDFAMFDQVLTRRFKQLFNQNYADIEERDNKCPDLVIIDGGRGHLNLAYNIYNSYLVDNNSNKNNKSDLESNVVDNNHHSESIETKDNFSIRPKEIKFLAIAKGLERNTSDETFYTYEVDTSKPDTSKSDTSKSDLPKSNNSNNLPIDAITEVCQKTIIADRKSSDNSKIRSFKLNNNQKLLFFLQRLRDEAHRFAIERNRKLRSKKISQSILDNIPGVGEKRKLSLLSWFGSERSLSSASVMEISRVAGVSKKLARVIYDNIRQ